MKLWRILLIALLALSSTTALSFGQGKYNRAAFDKAMESTIKNLRVLTGALVAEDWAKAQSSAEVIAAEGRTMRSLTPRESPDRIGEFQAHADSLAARGARVALAAKARDQKGATDGLGQMVQSCMGCHSIFRK